MEYDIKQTLSYKLRPSSAHNDDGFTKPVLYKKNIYSIVMNLINQICCYLLS